MFKVLAHGLISRKMLFCHFHLLTIIYLLPPPHIIPLGFIIWFLLSNPFYISLPPNICIKQFLQLKKKKKHEFSSKRDLWAFRWEEWGIIKKGWRVWERGNKRNKMREGRREEERTIKIVGGFCLLVFNESVLHCEQNMLDMEDTHSLFNWSKVCACQYKHLIVLCLNLVFKERLHMSPKHDPSVRTSSGVQLKKRYLLLHRV